MKVDELKYVVGEAQEAKPVYMRFYGKIDEEKRAHVILMMNFYGYKITLNPRKL